jgi:hypothetical protein
MGEASFKFLDNIIELEPFFGITAYLTITYKKSKSDEEEIKLGSLKYSFIKIFVP